MTPYGYRLVRWSPDGCAEIQHFARPQACDPARWGFAAAGQHG